MIISEADTSFKGNYEREVFFMAKYVMFRSDMSAKYFFHDVVLIISDSLSTEKKMEIIRECM